jgi:hypothetical protein
MNDKSAAIPLALDGGSRHSERGDNSVKELQV